MVKIPYGEKYIQEVVEGFRGKRLQGLGIGFLMVSEHVTSIIMQQVLDIAAGLHANHELPLARLEGILCQIIGWREFMLGVYRVIGLKQRQSNFWGIHNEIPQAFNDGSTGVGPVATIIRQVLENFMLLWEFHPDEVCQWFMELSVDACERVMVPNTAK